MVFRPLCGQTRKGNDFLACAIHPGQADHRHAGYSKCSSLLINGPCALRVLSMQSQAGAASIHAGAWSREWLGVCPEWLACWLSCSQSLGQLQWDRLGQPLDRPFPIPAPIPGA